MIPLYSQAGAALAFILLYTAYSLWQNLLHRQRARQYGCKPAYLRPYHLPFGIDIMKRYVDQMEQQNSQADDLVVYQELGARPTWYQNVLGYWHHVTADPKNIQAMLATQFKDFSLGPLRRGSFEPLIGHGIFTSDGKDWERSRALLRPQFARGQIAGLKLEETHVQHLLKRLVVDEADGWTARMDLVPLFFNLTLDSATEFFFGHSALSQTISLQEEAAAGKDVKPMAYVKTQATDSDWARFGECFDAANAAVLYRSRLMDLYFLYNPQSFREDCRHVHKCVDQVVDRALTRYESGKNDRSDVHGQGYLFIEELTKATQNRKELRSQLLNVLLAGRDTTAGLLGWTFYYLARHPAIYGKL